MKLPDEMERVLILVDDEPNVLSSLGRVFRGEGYRIASGQSGEEGLALLEAHPMAVVVSDQRMPHMNGAEFLSEATRRFPNTVRIILSGYTELNSVFDAINRGAVWKFLTKPWDDVLLREQVREAFEQLELRWRNARLIEEVQAKNAELERLNCRLSQQVASAASEASLSERSFMQAQRLLDTLPLAVLSISADGAIEAANDTAKRSLMAQAAGSCLGDLESPQLRALIGAAVRRKQPQSMAVSLPTGRYWLMCQPQEAPFAVQICLYPICEGIAYRIDGSHCLAVDVPLT